MGNNQSKRVSIVINPPQKTKYQNKYLAHVAGEWIRGSLFAEFDNFSIDSTVIAYFIGKEDCQVRYYVTESDSNNSTRTVPRYHYEKKDILRLPIPIEINQDLCSSGGRFEFPFALKIPNDLPSSMRCDSDGGYIELRYKIKVVGQNPKFSREQDIEILSAPISPTKLPQMVEPTTEIINTCCCFNSGRMTFGAMVEDTRLGKGTSIAVDFACSNESTVDVYHAEAVLKQEVTWWACGKSNYEKSVIAAGKFQNSELMKTRTREELDQMAQQPNNIMRSNEQQLYEQLYQSIMCGENRLTLRISEKAYDTYSGKHFKVDHTLKIKIHTGECATNPSYKLKMLIGTPSDLLPSTKNFPEPSAPLEQSDLIVPSTPPKDWGDAPFAIATPIVTTSPNVLNDIFLTAEVSVIPTFSNLMKEMNVSLNSVTLMKEIVQDDNWKKHVFVNMSPSNFASLIKSVRIEMEQPEVAVLVAPVIQNGNFTCVFLVAALRVVSTCLRVTVIQELLPLCTDVKSNKNKVLLELTEWEKVCTKQDFEKFLK